jgi:hypothetical protein
MQEGVPAFLKISLRNAGPGNVSRWDLTTQKVLFRGTGL